MRLREFDYSLPGAYFLTVCTKIRRQILSAIHEGCTILSAAGRICETQLLLLEERYPIKIERHVIMPNHVHMLLSLYRAEQRDSLPEEKRKSRRPGAKYRQFLLTTAVRRDKIYKLPRNRQKLLA